MVVHAPRATYRAPEVQVQPKVVGGLAAIALDGDVGKGNDVNAEHIDGRAQG